MKKGRRPRRRPPLKFSEKRRGSVPVLPGERAGFPLKIAGFLGLSRPVPVYPVFLKYVVPVQFHNEVFTTLEKVVDRLCKVICSLSPERIASITRRSWIIELFN